jgi:hypothetical protein
MSTKAKAWTIGLALVVAGLLVARVFAPVNTGEPFLEFGFYIAGVTLALAGLAVIWMGLRKKSD